MILYKDSKADLIESYLPRLFESYPNIHVVLLSPEKDGKVPIKEWRHHRPSLDEVLAHVRKKRRIGIVPRSIKQIVIDVDHGGFDSYPLVSKHFLYEHKDWKKYCIASGTKGNYHIWLPLKEECSLKKIKFILDENLEGDCAKGKSYASGDLICDHYVVWHHPMEEYLEAVIDAASDLDDNGKNLFKLKFDKEIADFKLKFAKGAKHESGVQTASSGKSTLRSEDESKIQWLQPKLCEGLSQWKSGERHDPMIAAFKVVTNPHHFRSHGDVTSCLSGDDISLIIQNNIQGKEIAAHAWACGHTEREVKDALRDHLIEVRKHEEYRKSNPSPKADGGTSVGGKVKKTKRFAEADILREELLDMGRVDMFERLLRECDMTLKYDPFRRMWEYREGDDNPCVYYPSLNKCDNFNDMKNKFADKYPSLVSKAPKGFKLSQDSWTELHAGFKRREHNQIDGRKEYLYSCGKLKKMIAQYDRGERTEEMDFYKTEASDYFKNAIGIRNEEEIEYVQVLSEYFFREYALCLATQKHMSKLVIVLMGEPGVRKTTFVEEMIPKELRDRGYLTTRQTHGRKADWLKEFGMAIEGRLGIELPEINLGKNVDLKSIIGCSSFDYRPLYKGETLTRERDFWMMGTANHDQLSLSAGDSGWVDKFAIIFVRKKIEDPQGYAEKHLRNAIIGGYLLQREKGWEYLNHPFSKENSHTVAYRRWKECTASEIGTPEEVSVAELIVGMMEDYCKDPGFSPSTYGVNIILTAKMNFHDFQLLLRAYYSEYKKHGETYELKAINDSDRLGSAMKAVGWKKEKDEKDRKKYWVLHDETGEWAKKGFFKQVEAEVKKSKARELEDLRPKNQQVQAV